MQILLFLRLLCAVVLCSAATLVVVQAPTMPLFRVALVATEFGALIAAVLFVSPVLRAAAVARRLPAEMARSFSRVSANSMHTSEVAKPLSWKKLWCAPSVPPVPVTTHEYATHEGAVLNLSYYRDSDPHAAPCVVVIHGGGWENGSAAEFPTLNHYLAHRGYAVAAIEYRFAPRWPWPAQREDVLDAVRYLQTHATELRLDPQRFVFLGRSAGGQIAEAVAYGAHDPAVRGCIAFYSPADMHYAFEFARADDILNSLHLVRQYLGGDPQNVRDNYDSASGILLASGSHVPTLLIHGYRDELVWFRQSQRLSDRLNALGAPHYFVQLPWATHAFDYNFNGPGGQISTYAVETFLAAVTR